MKPKIKGNKTRLIEPGFLFLSGPEELALEGERKNKKRGARSAPVFFMTSFGRDSAKLIPANLPENPEPLHLLFSRTKTPSKHKTRSSIRVTRNFPN